MKRSELIFGLLRLPTDAAGVGFALLIAYGLRIRNIDLIPGIQILEEAKSLPPFSYYISNFIVPGILLFFLIAALLKLYRIRVTLSFFHEEGRIILTTIVWVAIIMGWFFFIRKQLFFSRALLLHGTLLITLFTSCGRVLLTLAQRSLLKKGIGVHTIVSIGTLTLTPEAISTLENDTRYHYAGHLYPANNRHMPPLQELLHEHTISSVIQTDPSDSDATNELIDFCRSHHIGYAFLPPVLVDVPHLLSVSRLGSVPLLRFHPTSLDGWGAVLKRIGDIILSGLLLLLLTPLFLTIAIIIKCDSRGSILYKSKRVGQLEKGNPTRMHTINVIKFRSMVQNADKIKDDLREKSHRSDGPLFKIKNDPRITRVGKFIRRFSIDELPQLWNVFIGNLSLIGPRPHLPDEVEKYTDFQRRVFAVKPGITGLAQVSGRSDLSFEDEVRLDLRYIEEWNPWMDLWILWRTIGVVLKGNGAD